MFMCLPQFFHVDLGHLQHCVHHACRMLSILVFSAFSLD